jgi:hypothetical protein
MPASMTTTSRSAVESGVTSPMPSVNSVVPLRYRSVKKPFGADPDIFEPNAQ